MIWEVQILRGAGRRMDFGSQKNVFAKNISVCTLGTGIRLMVTITGGIHQYPLKQYQNFNWYLAVSTANSNLDHVHFQKGGELTPTLNF